MPEKVGTVQITRSKDQTLYFFSGPYHRPFIDKLVAEIPKGARQWDPVTKRWMIAGRFWKQALRIASEFFHVDYGW